MSHDGTAYRRDNTAMTNVIEVKCIKTVTKEKSKSNSKALFTAGETYIAILSKHGTYSVDADSGAIRTFRKEDFYEIFEEEN